MAAAELADRRQDTIELVETVHHHCHRGHQFGALLAHVTGEQRLQARLQLEQAGVEELGRHIRDRHDILEAFLSQGDLVRGHHFILRNWLASMTSEMRDLCFRTASFTGP